MITLPPQRQPLMHRPKHSTCLHLAPSPWPRQHNCQQMLTAQSTQITASQIQSSSILLVSNDVAAKEWGHLHDDLLVLHGNAILYVERNDLPGLGGLHTAVTLEACQGFVCGGFRQSRLQGSNSATTLTRSCAIHESFRLSTNLLRAQSLNL